MVINVGDLLREVQLYFTHNTFRGSAGGFAVFLPLGKKNKFEVFELLNIKGLGAQADPTHSQCLNL